MFLVTRPTRKYAAELAYWRNRKVVERTLHRRHYEAFFTAHFSFDINFFRGKNVLDVGCGPRGSLEWAEWVGIRVGVDPLAVQYRPLGTDAHRMRYVAALAESLPFRDESFDIISSFNSLDHVENPLVALGEVVRTLVRGGYFLLLTDIHRTPTPMEPATFGWEILEIAGRDLRLIEERRYEKADAHGMYDSVIANVPWNNADFADRYGVLSAKFFKP